MKTNKLIDGATQLGFRIIFLSRGKQRQK